MRFFPLSSGASRVLIVSHVGKAKGSTDPNEDTLSQSRGEYSRRPGSTMHVQSGRPAEAMEGHRQSTLPASAGLSCSW